MKQMIPYLAFNGNCREAIQFYQQCLGGDVEIMNWGDAPENACGEGMPKIEDDKVMHACLHDGEFTLMACDQPMSSGASQSVSMSIPCDSEEQVDKLFAALSDGGMPMMPPSKTFWNAYFGMCVDKYGFQWMFNYQIGEM